MGQRHESLFGKQPTQFVLDIDPCWTMVDLPPVPGCLEGQPGCVCLPHICVRVLAVGRDFRGGVPQAKLLEHLPIAQRDSVKLLRLDVIEPFQPNAALASLLAVRGAQ
ncbi:hypothetical protein N801_18875 [Knoellia aerolata DSM 18566]|uniref:Uncharacterized protein n=1 Tax=Knoellia aerolata DSM 18566 TaxID=1385519 RepID=A0A0A0JUM4_9MICO|nr:hypothetical protein N801_18875 [Knoellia aerolata DSM 18566]